MTLGRLFSGIADIPANLRDKTVSDVTSDSREAAENCVFVCIKGKSFDGHSAAQKVISSGAAAVVTENLLGVENEINVKNTREIYPELLANFYGNPEKTLKICAVTGTNGKTTTVGICAGIMRALGRKVGTVGTLGVDAGNGLVYSHDGPPTVPEPKKLAEIFAEMVKNGVEYCFVEASSQALAQNRFPKNCFRAAAFTNLTRDHLDYHGTMENYFAAKRSLFDNSAAAVVNIDDDYGKKIAEYCRERNYPLMTVSADGKADFYAELAKCFPHGSEFVLTDEAAQKSYPAHFALTGEYNILNALLACVLCKTPGFSLGEIVPALAKIEGVSGRLETLYNGKFTVIRDYAHTEDGLLKLLGTLRPLAKNRLICVFGAAGERDAGKRPDMGRAAAEFSDYLIVTTDSPRHENPQDTIDGVAAGIPAGKPFEEFIDREKAVLRSLEMAQEGDVIALCGKGHEDYQAIGDEYFHFDEKEIVERYFAGIARR